MRRAYAGMAVGALLLVGCASGSDDSGTATTAAKSDKTTTTGETTTTEGGGEGTGELTLEEWVDAADEICADFNAEVDDLGEPESLDDLLPMMDDILVMADGQRDDLQDLGLPTDEGQDEVERAFELLDEQVAVFEDALDEADGDPEALAEILDGDEFNTEMDDKEAELDDLADEIGLEECKSDSSSSGSDETTTTMGDDDTDTTDGGGSNGDIGSEDEIRDLIVEAATASGGITTEEAECIVDGLLDEFGFAELVEMTPDGEPSPELIEAITPLAMSCVDMTTLNAG